MYYEGCDHPNVIAVQLAHGTHLRNVPHSVCAGYGPHLPTPSRPPMGSDEQVTNLLFADSALNLTATFMSDLADNGGS